jgi:hypothetical protein
VNRRGFLVALVGVVAAPFVARPIVTALTAAGSDAPTTVLVDREFGISMRLIRHFDVVAADAAIR